MAGFRATLLKPSVAAGESVDWAFVVLPADASAALPSRGMVSVTGTLGGVAFSATLDPDGKGGHWLKVERELREAVGAGFGDEVTLALTPVAEEPEPVVPEDLRRALAAAAGRAREVWLDITPVARRDYVQWITSAKRAETRAARVERACDMLAKGKRRPCCFDRSGIYSKGLSCPTAEGAATAEPKPTKARGARARSA